MSAPTKPIQEPYLPKPIGGGLPSGGPQGTADDSDKYVDTARASAHKDRVKAPTKNFDRDETWLYTPRPADNEQLQRPTGHPGTDDLMP